MKLPTGGLGSRSHNIYGQRLSFDGNHVTAGDDRAINISQQKAPRDVPIGKNVINDCGAVRFRRASESLRASL